MARQKNVSTEYKNYYLPMHFPVLLLSGDYCKISDIPGGRLHFHNCLEIGICHSESGTLEIYGEKLHFSEGDVTVIPRNVPHTTCSTPGTQSCWTYLFLDPRELFRGLLPASWKNHDLSAHIFHGYKHILSRTDYPLIHQLVTGIITQLQEQKSNYQLSARGLLLSLYIELYRIENMDEAEGDDELQTKRAESGHSPGNSLMIAPALDFIEDNYMQQFTIEYLADLCHWSPTHFRRVFHEIMGTSPLDYVNNTRIMKSCNLLRSSEESILDISEMVGFHSISSYNRYFTKIMQMSPREYRKQLQQSEKRTEVISNTGYNGWLLK